MFQKLVLGVTVALISVSAQAVGVSFGDMTEISRTSPPNATFVSEESGVRVQTGLYMAHNSGWTRLAQGTYLHMSMMDGSLFNAVSMNMSEYSYLFEGDQFEITVMGRKGNGDLVSQSFQLDGIIGPSNANADLLAQNFVFPRTSPTCRHCISATRPAAMPATCRQTSPMNSIPTRSC